MIAGCPVIAASVGNKTAAPNAYAIILKVKLSF